MQATRKKEQLHPAISIVIPTFQEGNYIDVTLSRLRTVNSKVDLETIVVDGGSTDCTVQKAKALADKVCRTQRGILKARNLGALHAGGDIIIFLDTDVTLPKGFVE